MELVRIKDQSFSVIEVRGASQGRWYLETHTDDRGEFYKIVEASICVTLQVENKYYIGFTTIEDFNAFSTGKAEELVLYKASSEPLTKKDMADYVKANTLHNASWEEQEANKLFEILKYSSIKLTSDAISFLEKYCLIKVKQRKGITLSQYSEYCINQNSQTK